MIEFSATEIPGLYENQTETEWRACYLPAKSGSKTVKLKEAFNTAASLFLFAFEKPKLDNTFISQIYTFLTDTYPSIYVKKTDHCLLWLNQTYNPDLPKIYQFGQALIYNDSFDTKQNENNNSQLIWYNNRNYFAIPPASTVSVGDLEDEITIARTPSSAATTFGYGLYLTDRRSKNAPIRLGKIARNDKQPKKEPPLRVSFTAISCAIQFQLSFPLRSDAATNYQIGEDLYPHEDPDSNSDYTILPISLKYYYPKDKTKIEVTYQLFEKAKSLTLLDFVGHLHPAAVLNTDYTYFSFSPNVVLNSMMPTSYGKLISLACTANSRIVFCKSPDTKFGESRYYWTLAKDFGLLDVTTGETLSNEQNRILCGISGTETISFKGKSENYAGDLISFDPNFPACANVFPIQKDDAPTANVAILNSSFTTAWCALTKAASKELTGLSYCSQPNGAALFAPIAKPDVLPVDQPRILVYAAIASSDLAQHQGAYFPIAPSSITTPYLGTKKPDSSGYYTQDDIYQFEIQILNPARKLTITTAKKMAKTRRSTNLKTSATNELNLTTTPQGLMVNLTADQTEWQSLTVANPTEAGNSPLQFTNIDTEGQDTGLQDAFQTNEQFLVISNPVPSHIDFYNQYFQNKVDVAAWPFVLDITGANKWTNKTGFNNIVIFKFCSYSLEERVKNQKLWTDPQNFNQENKLTELSNWILAYIDTARKAIDEDPNSPFKKFYEMATDANWNGILCLQVTLELTSLPKEIKSILAGIDTTRFTAHHFGIEANQISLTPENKIDPNFKSSMFGLINYIDSTYEKGKKIVPLPETPGDFDFKVLELQVLFDKSVVKDFKSKIQLTLNTLFNESVSTDPRQESDAINANSIVLNGLYDKKNGNTSYTFSMSKIDTLNLDGIALQKVNISAIQLAAVDEKDTSQLTTRFYMSGALSFNELDNFDMFSYDALSFTNLTLDMSFDLDDLGPDHTPNKTFKFDPVSLIFNKTNVSSRGNSLVPNFPLDLTGLMYNSPTNGKKETPIVTPASLAYLSVDAPLATLNVTDTWYALRFNVNLGSLGALTAKVGFNAEILLAWSPGSQNNQAQVFIKMPFSGAKPAKGFSLQGILKFGVGDIMFLSTPAADQTKLQYAMVFTQIGVSVMGLTLPRNGNTIFYLFGNPNGSQSDASTGNLAWYGAYQADQKSKQLKNHNSLNP